MSMKKQQEEYLILPDEQLRELFKHGKRLIWIISLPMLAYVWLFMMFAPDIVLGDMTTGLIAFSAAAGFICYSFIFSNDSKKQVRRVAVADTIQLILLIMGMFTRNPTVTGIQIGFIVASNAANLVASSVIKDLAVLRSHPRYPFDNWRRDESYTKGIYSNGSYTDRALRRLEGTINKDKVQNIGGEEFFEGDKKKYEAPKHSHEDDLQQREQIWRQRDKSETAYTMDNLKNMYLGDMSDTGELTSDELEKKLWAETAPKKPKEPEPEDFFQQSPIIWRTNKDGSSSPERREPGSKPVGEKDSRSVLM